MVDAQETIARIWNQNIRDQKLRDKYFSFKNKKDVYFVVTARTVGNVKKKKKTGEGHIDPTNHVSSAHGNRGKKIIK